MIREALTRNKEMPVWLYILIVSFAFSWDKLFSKDYPLGIIKFSVLLSFFFLIEIFDYMAVKDREKQNDDNNKPDSNR